jgi:hypothetical protein
MFRNQTLCQTASIEIDEREKAVTELSSRLAALPDTPSPNTLHEVSQNYGVTRWFTDGSGWLRPSRNSREP